MECHMCSELPSMVLMEREPDYTTLPRIERESHEFELHIEEICSDDVVVNEVEIGLLDHFTVFLRSRVWIRLIFLLGLGIEERHIAFCIAIVALFNTKVSESLAVPVLRRTLLHV